MKADKVIVRIEIEALSIDAVNGLLVNVMRRIEDEAESGELSMADGDSVKWSTTRTPVNF